MQTPTLKTDAEYEHMDAKVKASLAHLLKHEWPSVILDELPKYLENPTKAAVTRLGTIVHGLAVLRELDSMNFQSLQMFLILMDHFEAARDDVRDVLANLEHYDGLEVDDE